MKAATLLASGASEREVCKKIRVGKGTINRWKKDPSFNKFITESGQAIRREHQLAVSKVKSNIIKESQEDFENYLQELKLVKQRQKKWASAITETGIKSLKVVNSYLSLADDATKRSLTKQQMDLVKLIPSFMRAASDTIRSASDAEDKAYSLFEMAFALDELSQNLPQESRASDLKNISTTDSRTVK